MDYKAFAFEMKREPTDDGVIEGYASVFEEVDNGLDVVSRGAFRKSLGSGRKVRMLWHHDKREPIGVWDEIREDERGLYVKGRILKDVKRGADAIALYRAGAMDSLSIGYRAKVATPEGGGRVRRLEEIDLYEISAVTIPMLDSATVSVKSIDWTNKRDVEAGLRDVFGLSQAEAKAFIADGFAGLAAKRDVGTAAADSEGASALMEQIRLLQGRISNV